MYTWRFASPDDYDSIHDMFHASPIAKGDGLFETKRRIVAPLVIRHLIGFYDSIGKLCGFVTFANLNAEAEQRIPETGILPADWRSGNAFWVIDLIVQAGCDGFKMLRAVTRDLGIKRAKFFSHKHQEVREVRTA